jgi:hypothetical protein
MEMYEPVNQIGHVLYIIVVRVSSTLRGALAHVRDQVLWGIFNMQTPLYIAVGISFFQFGYTALRWVIASPLVSSAPPTLDQSDPLYTNKLELVLYDRFSIINVVYEPLIIYLPYKLQMPTLLDFKQELLFMLGNLRTFPDPLIADIDDDHVVSICPLICLGSFNYC